eukprot:3933359-Rhodomonas_salina.2
MHIRKRITVSYYDSIILQSFPCLTHFRHPPGPPASPRTSSWYKLKLVVLLPRAASERLQSVLTLASRCETVVTWHAVVRQTQACQ